MTPSDYFTSLTTITILPWYNLYFPVDFFILWADSATCPINSSKLQLTKPIFIFNIVWSDKLESTFTNFSSSLEVLSGANNPSQSNTKNNAYGVFINEIHIPIVVLEDATVNRVPNSLFIK